MENTCCCHSAISARASARPGLTRGVGKTALRGGNNNVRPRRQTQPARQLNICAGDRTAHRIVNKELNIAAGSTRKKPITTWKTMGFQIIVSLLIAKKYHEFHSKSINGSSVMKIALRNALEGPWYLNHPFGIQFKTLGYKIFNLKSHLSDI